MTPIHRDASRALWLGGHDPAPACYADFLLFLSSSTSVNSASTTSSLAASLAASLSACCLYMASPSFIEACASVLVLVLIASASSPFSASFRSLTASSMPRRAPSQWNAPAHPHGSWRRPPRGASCPRPRWLPRP